MSELQQAVSSLFQPFRSDRLNTDNRIVMAPMTRGYSPDGVPGDDVAAYYGRRAAHGVGLIITEGTLIEHPAAGANPNWPHFFGHAALEGWSKAVKAVHAAGGKIVPQLWHVGMARKIGDLPNPDTLPIGPSGLDLTGEKVTQPLSENEIEALISSYAQAAEDAVRIGFDGIELHGAHGYLIDQFFWGRTNRREDKYGGDLAARTRFAVEVIRACRRSVGPDFPIILRFSQWKPSDYDAKLAETPAELDRFLAPLADAGVDVFHCSTRRYWEAEYEGSPLNLAGWTKKLTGKPTITVGSVGLDNEFRSSRGDTAQTAEIDDIAERLDRGEFDLVAVGRALLANPDWAELIRSGRPGELKAYDTQVLRSLY
ncbi:NADH:flavin oxidoreductase [Paenibacillus humicola]|uniref:NADH:flavin oxidoreductase n=1 Tax=Paenibacillus humicola TaxID=3110540 RepID=UPI003B835EF4